MRVLAFAAAIPLVAVCARAEEPDKPAYISIEILDASGNSLTDSVTEQDGLLIWSGTASLAELPPEKKEEPVVLKGNSRKRNNVPLYFQNQYPDIRYGSGTVATSGCSITSLAMVASYMTDHLYSPAELADYFGGSAYSNMARLEAASDALQLPYKKAANWHESLQALKDGKVVIALVEEASIFTESQHFIVLTGMTDDGKILVNDPNLSNYARWELQKGFVEGFTEGDILCGYSGGWIYDKVAMPQEPFLYYEEEVLRESRYPGLALTTEDLDLLAKVVWVEAQGESFEGQQAVAEVVLNRLVSPNFPNTVHDVIYAEGQFRSVPYLEDATPWQVQYEAIEAAVYGPNVLPMDVMYFAQQPTNNNVWGKIGGHVFCFQEEV
mgnify:CR=1 FL=1